MQEKWNIRSIRITTHGWTAIFGAIGLTTGMWLQFMQPSSVHETLALMLYIIGGFILLISFTLFVILTFMTTKEGEC